ncbi:MAG: hypothetical protein WCO42_03075 [bacterium]
MIPCSRASLVLIFGLFVMCKAEAQMPALPEGGGQMAVPSTDDQSGLAVTPSQRDPFWPVGYAPKPVVRKPEMSPEKRSGETPPDIPRGPLWDEARKKLDIRGISLIHDKMTGKSRYLAMVSRKLIEEGNVISIKYDNLVYRWKVVGINEEGLSLQKLDVRSD